MKTESKQAGQQTAPLGQQRAQGLAGLLGSAGDGSSPTPELLTTRVCNVPAQKQAGHKAHPKSCKVQHPGFTASQPVQGMTADRSANIISAASVSLTLPPAAAVAVAAAAAAARLS